MSHQHPTERAQSPSHAPGHPSGPLASPGELNEPHADAQPPADRAALRDRIAQAIHDDLTAHRGRLDQGLLGIVPRLTDAVLAVLPDHAAVRAAALNEGAARLDERAAELTRAARKDPLALAKGATDARYHSADCWNAAAAELRRLADARLDDTTGGR